MSRLIACGLTVIALASGLMLRTPAALADADPASDTLLIDDAFYPYQPNTPAPVRAALEHALAEIHTTGLDLKVAIIRSPVDLGGIPELFGQPQRYVKYLDYELSYQHPQPLLVVMPDGVAIADAGSASAVHGITIDARDGSAGLAETAMAAVERIASARGKPIAAPEVATPSGGAPVALIGVIVAALLALGAGGWAAQRGRLRSTGRAGRRRSDVVGSGS